MKYSKKNKSGLDWFVFEEVKDSDHIRAAVSFIIKESTRPLYCIEYYSSLFGIVGWFRKEDKYQIQVWEGEDQERDRETWNGAELPGHGEDLKDTQRRGRQHALYNDNK